MAGMVPRECAGLVTCSRFAAPGEGENSPINNIDGDIELIPLDSIIAGTSSQRDLERMHRSVVGTRRCASD